MDIKLPKAFVYYFLLSVLCVIDFFPKDIGAEEWTPVAKDPSPYFFVDRERNEWILIEGVRAQDESFQKDRMRVYQSIDGKNFFSLTVINFHTEETSLGGNPTYREWITLKNPKNSILYELYFSKMEWKGELRQNFEILFLKSDSFDDGNRSVRKYVRTYLSCGEIRSLVIHKE